MTRTITHLLLLALLWAGASLPAVSQPRQVVQKTVVAQGTSGTCWRRDTSIQFALSSAANDARDECRALGSGWYYKGVQFEGRQNCQPCRSKNEFKCEIRQAVHVCESRRR